MGRICDSCGKQISDEIASFCSYCGANVIKLSFPLEGARRRGSPVGSQAVAVRRTAGGGAT
ncbi:MAG: zinc ribbon domain-containing protein [Selenomonas ruminantium]|nr:zinc ribbon domain-containing protein [Selenomonas ruminantium]